MQEKAVSAQLIDGKKISAEVRAEVADSVREMKERLGVTPGLAVVLVGDDPASAVYVRNKQRAATEVGMEAQTCACPRTRPRSGSSSTSRS